MRIQVGLERTDKVQLAFDQMLGVQASAGKGVQPFRSIKQAYLAITGDHDFSLLSSGAGFFRTAQAPDGVATTGDFANILVDAINKKLLQEWAEPGSSAALEQLYVVGSATDSRTQYRVRDGFFADLDDVAEGADYQSIDEPTDEQISFAVVKKGNVLDITEETIRNDNLGAITRWPGKLARAGRHTLKAAIMAKLVTPPNYQPDTTAWFHANHSNLLSDAYSTAALAKAKAALYGQTEKDSGNKLELTLDWVAVPAELWGTAVAINQARGFINGGVEEPNAFYHKFGANDERIYELPFADATDWYYGTDKANAPCIEVCFRDGQSAPQVITANDPRVGKMFTSDKLQLKVKWGFGIGILDFRGIGKSVVA